MEIFSAAIMMIGLVFDIMLIIFILVSVLLIYSLLMITVETKTFDIAVMRMVGLSSNGFVAMIFTQAMIFVLPSLILAFACCVPCLWLIYNAVEEEHLAFSTQFIPGMSACL